MYKEPNKLKTILQVGFKFEKFQGKKQVPGKKVIRNQKGKDTNIKDNHKAIIQELSPLKKLLKVEIYLMIPKIKEKENKYK